MEKERSEEKGDVIDLKLGVGGLADLEFLAQGHQLIDGYRTPALRGRSVRSAVRGLSEVHLNAVGNARDAEMAFTVLRSLEHRLRLFSNLTASRLTPSQFESLVAIGLWPSPEGGNAIESWEDLLRIRRRVRSFLQTRCVEL